MKPHVPGATEVVIGPKGGEQRLEQARNGGTRGGGDVVDKSGGSGERMGLEPKNNKLIFGRSTDGAGEASPDKFRLKYDGW